MDEEFAKRIPFWEEINSCKYLYLRNLLEPADNQLQIVIEEAKAGRAVPDVDVGGVKIGKGDLRAIESDETCHRFKLSLKDYVGYSVINETTAAGDPAKNYIGRLLRLYTESHFLDYLKSQSDLFSVFTGTYLHLEICCLNHVINVVSKTIPLIEMM